jgi:hypothetical protein
MESAFAQCEKVGVATYEQFFDVVEHATDCRLLADVVSKCCNCGERVRKAQMDNLMLKHFIEVREAYLRQPKDNKEILFPPGFRQLLSGNDEKANKDAKSKFFQSYSRALKKFGLTFASKAKLSPPRTKREKTGKNEMEKQDNTDTWMETEENDVVQSYNTFQKGFRAGYNYCVYEGIFAPPVPMAFPNPFAAPPGLGAEY